MATRLPAPGELVCVDESERKMINLCEHVERNKEKVRRKFIQLHGLLFVRETFLLKEMDDIVTRSRQKIKEKKRTTEEQNTAREGLEMLAKNELIQVLEKNLRQLEDEIRKELAREVSVVWIELECKWKQLEESVMNVGKVVPLNEKPVTPVDIPVAMVPVDYSAKMCSVWFSDGRGASEISGPMQLAIDDTSQNIFVTDFNDNRIQVFDGEGNHLYQIPTPPAPNGLALTNDHIYVSTREELVKLQKSNSVSKNLCRVKSFKTERPVSGIYINKNVDIYGCEVSNKTVIVFDKFLKFQKTIKLRTTYVRYDTTVHSIILFEDKMYVMFDGRISPPFHLQVFTQKGELVRCLLKQNEIGSSYFFSIDMSGNIIVADRKQCEIKIFSNKGVAFHTITTSMLPGDQEISRPRGIAIDKKNRIIVAQQNKKCNLLAF